MYRLLFQGRLATRPALAVREPQLWLGRDESCQVQLPENGVSPRHAVIERRADGYYITDLHSEVGLRVNGQPVTQHRLRAGDQIEIGSVTLRFEVAHDVVSTARRTDWLLHITAVVVTLLVLGQIALLAWIFTQPRPSAILRPPPPPVTANSSEEPAATPPSPTPATPAPTATAPARPAILNRQLRIERLTEITEAARLIVQIQIRAQVGERELDNRAVAVSIHFFLRGSDGIVSPWEPPFWLDRTDMKNFTTKTFQATFPGLPAQYAGCVVRTFYRNQLQDEAANPPELLARAPAPVSPQ